MSGKDLLAPDRSGTQKFDRAEMMKLKFENGLSNYKIGQILGVSEASIRGALKKIGGDTEAHELRKGFQSNKANVLETLQLRVLMSLSDEDIEKMSGKDRIIAIGILHDKIRLERDQATSNHAIGLITQAVRDATMNG